MRRFRGTGGRRGGAYGVGVLGAVTFPLQFSCWFGEGTGLVRPLSRASVSGPGAAFLPGPGSAARCPVPAPPPGPSTMCDSGPTKPRPPAPGHTGSQGGAAWGGGSSFSGCTKPPAPTPATCVPGLQRDLTASEGVSTWGVEAGGGGTLGGQPPGAELSPSTTVPPKGAAALGASDQPPGLCSPAHPPSP